MHILHIQRYKLPILSENIYFRRSICSLYRLRIAEIHWIRKQEVSIKTLLLRDSCFSHVSLAFTAIFLETTGQGTDAELAARKKNRREK
jgi:hypothetical protein